ncbi:LysR family transcriptional regulator [Palleronia sp. LCG004]|uniref:LysR family transcriptional regulator n=1 Tax=Palleronia sp. LCG004 TaxID=3079304 RepID=UPI002942D063|nr:LysR family transcriptional regulator [Palleronia sp. LCG004]WOI56855.1 LysR family transcriptional regulator [Palleronia sp. LCG004]
MPSAGALFVFEAAARHENFTRAAEELNVTQPAVSRTLASLEGFLGTNLFLRKRPGAMLSEDGKILRAAVSDAFSGIENALRRIEERKTGKVTITLSVSTAFTTHWLMPRISRFHAAFPQIDLRFQLIAGPLSGPIDDVDLAMRFVDPGSSRGRFVMHEAYVPLCAPDYFERSLPRGPTLIRLENMAAADLQKLLAAEHRDFDEDLAFSDYSVVVQAALVGQGIASGWLNVAAYWLAEGRLVPATGTLVRPGRDCRLLTGRTGAPDWAVDSVARWIADEIAGDIRAAATLYPDLGLERVLNDGGSA